MGRRAFSNLPLLPGNRLPRYTIERKLSSGGFGIVYLARREDGQKVALKEFLPSVIQCRIEAGQQWVEVPEGAESRRFRNGLESFFREADTLARFHDPRVIQVWDVFEANGTAYFAMPFERGTTLQAAIRCRPTPFSDAQLRTLFLEASAGVLALHRHGLYHLDLKPSNLWLRPDGTVVVLDLGASRWQDEEGRASQMARTPGFAAPEQHGARRPDVLGATTDVYGLSATLYAAMEGAPPVPAPQRGGMPMGLVQARAGQRDERLLELVERGMEVDPSLRWPDIGKWRTCLERMSHLPASNPDRLLRLSAIAPLRPFMPAI